MAAKYFEHTLAYQLGLLIYNFISPSKNGSQEKTVLCTVSKKKKETRNRKHRRAAAKPAACAQHP